LILKKLAFCCRGLFRVADDIPVLPGYKHAVAQPYPQKNWITGAAPQNWLFCPLTGAGGRIWNRITARLSSGLVDNTLLVDL
jgi:hypothetical protein